MLHVTWESLFIVQCCMLPESHTLLSSAVYYLRITLYCPVLNVTWGSLFMSSAECYLRVTLYFPVLSVTLESRFIVRCWMLPEGHAFLSSAECYLRATLYYQMLNATWVILYCPVLMLPQSDSLLSSAECYLRVTLDIIVHCWMLGCFRSYYVISWPTQLRSRLCINLHVNVCYQYCHVKCPHKISYN